MKLLYNETIINNQNVYQIDVPYSWHCKTGNYYPGFNFTDFDEIEVIRKGSFIEYCLNSEYGFEKTCIIFTVCDYLEFVKKGLTWQIYQNAESFKKPKKDKFKLCWKPLRLSSAQELYN